MSTNEQGGFRLRALRGATTAAANSEDAIVAATTELLSTLFERNEVATEEIVSIIFTATADLDAEFPAAAARGMGIDSIPLLCAREMEVPGSVSRCIRVLVHLYSDRAPSALRHAYLHDARSLRTDLQE
jgi:chorismate mutase